MIPVISKREAQILRLIAHEFTTKEIAANLFVKPN